MCSRTCGVLLVSLLVFISTSTLAQGVNNDTSRPPAAIRVVPRVVTVDDVVIRENAVASLHCSGADVIAWYNGRTGKTLTNESPDDKGTPGKYVITESTLNVTRVGRGDVGVYVCYDGLTRTNYSVQLFMKPMLGRRLPVSLNMAEGDTLKLACDVYGWPIPGIQWLRIDPVSGAIQPITVNVTAADARVVVNGSVLIITPLTRQDYMAYTCVATNNYGSANVTTLVRVKGKYTAVWPFVGAILEVIVLVAVIMYFEKKKAKEISKKKAMQEEEEKLLNAQMTKGEIKQRK